MRIRDELRLDINIFKAAVVLRPVTEPADGADKVALIGNAYDGGKKSW